VPVLFGTFLKDTSVVAVVSAALTAVFVHFGVYYGQLTPYTQGAIANPGVASALGIVSSLLVGGIFYFTFRKVSN
jgi:sodium/pantothenate symporter